MELKIKFKLAAALFFLFCAMITIDWYKNINYVSIYDENNDKMVPSAELYKYSERYTIDMNRDYKIHSVNTIRKTKTKVPFFFNREILSSTTKSLVIVPNR